MLETYFSFGINKVRGGPVLVVERVPDLVVTVQRDGISYPKLSDGFLHILRLLFKIELGRVDSDDYQAAVFVLIRPGANIGNVADAVDAGVVPEIN
jgi:hypothetical protein